MEWHSAVDAVTPHVTQIATPNGSGTGFFLLRAVSPGLCAVATAAHVIDHANFWEQPIRLRSAATGQIALLREADRAIFTDPAQDTAVILFDAGGLSLPPQPHKLIREGYIQKVGSTIGWLGFPAIGGADLCFFSGTISAWVDEYKAYFVDGVAINGVSGGPAFQCYGAEPEVVGVVSAYIPNRATGETLPGLAIVRDVTHLRNVVQRFHSLEEAKAEESAPSVPPSPPPADAGGGTGRAT